MRIKNIAMSMPWKAISHLLFNIDKLQAIPCLQPYALYPDLVKTPYRYGDFAI